MFNLSVAPLPAAPASEVYSGPLIVIVSASAAEIVIFVPLASFKLSGVPTLGESLIFAPPVVDAATIL